MPGASTAQRRHRGAVAAISIPVRESRPEVVQSFRARPTEPAGEVLEGLSIVDLSSTLTGIQMSQVLADFGADVLSVEPPGGHPLRAQPAWYLWARGRRSAILDLDRDEERDVARSLVAQADVVIETWRPGVAERLGLGYETFAELNPRLIYASVTGFGRDNSMSQLKCYEPVVMAKIGAFDSLAALSDRPGPSYITSPYTTWSGGQLALHGILAALYERESSGLGQRVESTMVQGLLAQDPWAWMLGVIARRYPEAYTEAPLADYEAGIPNSPLFFRLLVGLSKDGRWMQFSQTTERLWQAFLRVTGLDVMLADPAFKDGPISEDPAVRVAFWEKALSIVRSRTYEQWLAVFDEHTDVWAETFRAGSEVLHHPQMVFDHRTTVIQDASAGPVLQPGPLVQMERTPARLDRGAPTPDEHGREARNRHGQRRPAEDPARGALGGTPLAGVTIVELGTFFAGPMGAAILAELGARVIKVEPLEGDAIRWVMPFPEVGGVKAMQGKESIAVDMTSPEGRKVVLELVRRSDVVLQSFRAGVADRHGYTADDLSAVNPNLVYLNAPGYGIGGPMGHRPAFAPTIGAASGLGYRNIGGRQNVPQRADLSPDEVKRYSLRLAAATMGVGHADGFSALGTATALLLGLLGRRRLGVAQAMSTSMLSTMAHVLSEDVVEYADRLETPRPDGRLLGLGPLWRLYETAKGWVFLAAPSEADWAAVVSVFGLPLDLRDQPIELEAALEDRFRSKSALEWETALTSCDVACVEVVAGPVDAVMMRDGSLGDQLGLLTKRDHAVLGEYPRLGPLVRFSRSSSVIGDAPVCGRDTQAILAELGYPPEAIEALRAAQVVGG